MRKINKPIAAEAGNIVAAFALSLALMRASINLKLTSI